MLIVCDLDRTLIPNGQEPDPKSLNDFYNYIDSLDNATLAYATGRNLALFKEGKKEYDLLLPDYFLGAVGTEVYKKHKKIFGGYKLKTDSDWIGYVKKEHPNWKRNQIIKDLDYLIDDNFYLQEDDVQNNNKISFYLKNTEQKEPILSDIKKYLDTKEINSEVVYSFDPHKGLGLVDVLPKKATKLGAVEFLVDKLGIYKEDVVYAGDSGNDLLPLTAGIKAILVNNARQEVKDEALNIVKEKKLSNKLYISEKNYSAGVIEGLKHYLK
jgi:sucrose-6F-phosphate phosphohydrolase